MSDQHPNPIIILIHHQLLLKTLNIPTLHPHFPYTKTIKTPTTTPQPSNQLLSKFSPPKLFARSARITQDPRTTTTMTTTYSHTTTTILSSNVFLRNTLSES